MDSKIPSLLLKMLLGECGFGSAAKQAFWNFILELDRFTHSFPGTAGQQKLATSRENLLLPSRRKVQHSPFLQAGRSQREEGGGERGQVCCRGKFSAGDRWRKVNKSLLITPAVGYSKVDWSWSFSPGTLSKKGRYGICPAVTEPEIALLCLSSLLLLKL